MPVIYDIETLLASEISSDDGIFMLDSSDASMSSLGSNKLEGLSFFS